MKFWILEQRDTYTRETDKFCFYNIEETFNLSKISDKCPSCTRVIEPLVWTRPFNISLSKAQCGDIVLGNAFEILVSKKFKQVYCSYGLSGLGDFHPIDSIVSLDDKKLLDEISTYFVVRPKIKFTFLKEKESGLVWSKKPTCNFCRLGVRKGLRKVVVDEESWDGSDVFMGTGFYGVILVTDKFVQAIEENHLSNFIFIPSGNYSEDFE